MTPVRIWISGLTMVCAMVAACSIAAAQDKPYAGEQNRAVAALSDADISDILAGGGWGLAKPAEFNGWPGPAHVLELSGDLELSDDQRRTIEGIFDQMQADAQRVGAEYVAAEVAIDAAFSGAAVPDRSEIAELTGAAALLLAELRTVHLAAHLNVKPVLSRHQIVIYQRLRGYADGAESHSAHKGHDGH